MRTSLFSSARTVRLPFHGRSSSVTTTAATLLKLRHFDHERYRRELDYRRRGFNLQFEQVEGLDPPGRTLVDFGAGVAYFCAIAQERGWKATAIEVSPDAIAQGDGSLESNMPTWRTLQTTAARSSPPSTSSNMSKRRANS